MVLIVWAKLGDILIGCVYRLINWVFNCGGNWYICFIKCTNIAVSQKYEKNNICKTLKINKMNIADWKYEHLVKQIHRTAYKPHENFIINSLIHDERMSDLLPLTQHYVKRVDNKYALIDLFYPQLNLAIEIDEKHHNKNLDNDILRQNDVEQNLTCKFERITISEGNILEQIDSLKNKILLIKNSLIENWNSWQQPKIHSIFQMKNEYKNTLFVKIRGVIKPEDLMSRQTGYWRIDYKKREKIMSVVVVHDSVISRVFTSIKWISFDNNKVGFIGTENIESNLLGNIVTDWKTQQTINYSNDVY
jgi:very-short-patch-repair endonuclease